MTTKNNNMSDDFIISAINGEDAHYSGEYRIYRLEQLLTEQSPLSEDVLEVLILSPKDKVPDYFVELFTALSKEKGNILSLIATERPNIDIQFIAQNLRKNKKEDRFIKINTTPRKIIFANEIIDIKELSSNGCESCSRDIRTNKKGRLVNLSISDDVVRPIGGPAGKCAGIPYCGFASQVVEREEDRDLPYSVFSITCDRIVAQECFTPHY